MRPGAGSTAMRTSSIPAAGGWDSRSSSTSVRSTFGSRMGAASSSARWCTSRVTSLSHTWTTTAPRSLRARWSPSASKRRASTNDSGSSPSIGHSSAIACSNRSSSTSRTSGRRILAARESLPASAGVAEALGQRGARERGERAERVDAPPLERRERVGTRRGRGCPGARGRRRVSGKVVVAWQRRHAVVPRRRYLPPRHGRLLVRVAFVDDGEHGKGDRGEGGGLASGQDDADPLARGGERHGRRPRRRYRDAEHEPCSPAVAFHLAGECARATEKARQPAGIDHDETLAAALDARRAAAGHIEQARGDGALLVGLFGPAEADPHDRGPSDRDAGFRDRRLDDRGAGVRGGCATVAVRAAFRRPRPPRAEHPIVRKAARLARDVVHVEAGEHRDSRGWRVRPFDEPPRFLRGTVPRNDC